MKVKRYLFIAGPILILVLLLGNLAPLPAQAAETPERVMRSVVQIYATEESRGGLSIKWTGSGTVVSEDGLVLTNCHVALPRAMWDYPEFDYDYLIIGMTIRSDEPPQPTYIAEVLQYDPMLDLAVIKITHTMDGNPVDPDDLDLPALPLGDSDEIDIGDNLNILGYPGIGGEQITFTKGSVSGFSKEPGVVGRAWIKTDATIAGGNSGGTGFNDDGELIGVPTEGGYGGASPGEFADCRYLADTNGDGVIDENDTCIPMGGFINALRPVNLAKPLIEAARRGLPQPDPDPNMPDPTPTGDAAIGRIVFAPGVNEYDQPVTVYDYFPSNTPEIYMVFDYENFQEGISWQPELYLDGELIEGLWAPTGWNGGASGAWWISIFNDEGLPDGEYEFELNYAGETLASATVEIGGVSSTAPSFWHLTFFGDGEEGFFLPAGISEVEAEFEFENQSSDTEWGYIWYYEGEAELSGEGNPFTSSAGVGAVSAQGRFDAGRYRLDLWIDDHLAATSDFFVGGGQDGGDGGEGGFFSEIVFAEGVDRNDNPVGTGTSFDSGITDLYAFFDYEGMQDGWSLTKKWYIDGELVLDIDDTWGGGESGSWWVSVYSDNGLPDGEYQLELYVEGQLAQTGECTIGEPGQSTGPTTPTDGVEIYGYITDADTGRGIDGAMILFLMPDVTIDTFQWVEEEVYSMGETDRQGYYELSVPLERGQIYSVIVGAQGYNLIAEDGIAIPDDLDSPFQLDITLQQQ
jgi:putative serine protease PepD